MANINGQIKSGDIVVWGQGYEGCEDEFIEQGVVLGTWTCRHCAITYCHVLWNKGAYKKETWPDYDLYAIKWRADPPSPPRVPVPETTAEERTSPHSSE